MITVPVFAIGISATDGAADSATCDTNVLGTDTGPANLRAEFTPEVINLKWYNDGAQVNVPTASNNCTYDTPISLPSNPTKPGYTFKGWKVVPKFDFSTLDYMFTPVSAYTYNEANKTWYSRFSDDTINGIALCSNTQGNNMVPGTPDETVSNGQYCWCKIIGYTPNNDSVMHEPSSNLPWVFHEISGGHAGNACVDICAQVCCFRFNDNRQESQQQVYTFRRALFGQSGS